MTRSRHRIEALALVGAVALLAFAGGARASGDARVLEGHAPSGASYRLTWHRDGAGRLCERLALRAHGDTSGSRHCQPRHGASAHGMWTLDCTTLDLVVYGRTYARGARVSLRPHDGGRVRARRPGGGGPVFLLVADARRLPGAVEVRASHGHLLRKLRFGPAEDLCAGTPRPLIVGYAF